MTGAYNIVDVHELHAPVAARRGRMDFPHAGKLVGTVADRIEPLHQRTRVGDAEMTERNEPHNAADTQAVHVGTDNASADQHRVAACVAAVPASCAPDNLPMHARAACEVAGGVECDLDGGEHAYVAEKRWTRRETLADSLSPDGWSATSLFEEEVIENEREVRPADVEREGAEAEPIR
jgi:hypothetical protein